LGHIQKKAGALLQRKPGFPYYQHYPYTFYFGKIWLATEDGSRFSRAHLEFPEIKDLSELGRVQALKLYASQPLRYFFYNNLNFTQIVSLN
jgi:hypothetical protein